MFTLLGIHYGSGAFTSSEHHSVLGHVVNPFVVTVFPFAATVFPFAPKTLPITSHVSLFCMKRITAPLIAPLSKRGRIYRTSSSAMAPPPLPESDLQEERHVQRPLQIGTQTTKYLINMSEVQRTRYFKRAFFQRVEPLRHIKQPPLAEDHPDLAEGIVEAYLRHTTFTVKVWVNYDAAGEKFFCDKRARDCGELVLSTTDYQRLQRKLSTVIELSRVRFGVGTPFKVLYHLEVSVPNSKLDLHGDFKVNLNPATSKHPLLLEHLQDVFDKIEDLSLPHGQKGLQLCNIEHLAAMLVRRPTTEEVQKKDRERGSMYRFTSPWMDLVGDNQNPGWVDVKGMWDDTL